MRIAGSKEQLFLVHWLKKEKQAGCLRDYFESKSNNFTFHKDQNGFRTFKVHLAMVTKTMDERNK